ncbi:zinc finger Ran-binding domain-containing protein 2-like [Dermacentor albipictus]|uniref:zinc finger Ran-binding domain-containing protein 2-like n=1 Tax=Dermacentor albipictus TaxID=60249 RepID=UPI0038FD0CAC
MSDAGCQGLQAVRSTEPAGRTSMPAKVPGMWRRPCHRVQGLQGAPEAVQGASRAAYGGRQSRHKSLSGQQQQHRKRWLSSEGDQSQSRNQSQERRGSSRSRSRNSSRSRSRTNAPQSSQGIKGGKQQPQLQRHQKKQKPNNNINNGKTSSGPSGKPKMPPEYKDLEPPPEATTTKLPAIY